MSTGAASDTDDAATGDPSDCDPKLLPPVFTLDTPYQDLVFTPGEFRMVAVTNNPPDPADIVLLDPCGDLLTTLVSGVETGRLRVGLDGDLQHLYHNYGSSAPLAGLRRADFPRGAPGPLLDGTRVRDFVVDPTDTTLFFVGDDDMFRFDLTKPGAPTPLGIPVSPTAVDLALAPDGHALAWVDLWTKEVRIWDFEAFASTLVTTVPGLTSTGIQWLDNARIAYIGATDGLTIETFDTATAAFGLLYASPNKLINGFTISPLGARLVLLWPSETEIRALE